MPTLRLIRNPIQALRDWQAEFGQTFTVNRLGVPTVMTADPDLIGQIYGVRDAELFGPVLPDTVDVLLGRSSLLLVSGRKHQAERKLMMPSFHGERMRWWADDIANAARRAFAVRGSQRALQCAQRATLETIVRVVFGVDDAREVEVFVQTLSAWAASAQPGFLFFRALQHELLGFSSFARNQRLRERVDALLLEQIARARHRGGHDVLSCLVEARDEDSSPLDDATICDHLRTLLFAGHETTAIILGWAIDHVHRDPSVLARLRDEVEAVGTRDALQLSRLPYLGAVVDEVLRMRPISVDIQRTLTKPWQLGAWNLPAGSAVCPAIPLLHYREDLWTDPERFHPDRFLSAKPEPNTYLPFGGGAHRCLGATFARFELCIMLGTLIGEFEIQLEHHDDEPWVRGRTALEPGLGVPVVIRSR